MAHFLDDIMSYSPAAQEKAVMADPKGYLTDTLQKNFRGMEVKVNESQRPKASTDDWEGSGFDIDFMVRDQLYKSGRWQLYGSYHKLHIHPYAKPEDIIRDISNSVLLIKKELEDYKHNALRGAVKQSN